MKIKMCGITTPADVAAVNEVRPDYIGMVMYFPKSKRNVSVETARRLLEELRKDVKKVAVVVSPDAEQIAEIGELGFDVIQIHGQTSDELIESAHLPVWKAFNVKDMDMYPHYQSLSNVAGYVFDAGEPGSGKTFDWNSLTDIDRDGRLFVLAGGLTPDNVRRAIEQVHPIPGKLNTYSTTTILPTRKPSCVPRDISTGISEFLSAYLKYIATVDIPLAYATLTNS